MADAAYRGRATAVAPHVGCLVTLGTPHDLHHTDARWRHQGVQLSAFLAEHSPGARFAPTTGYLTVASDAVRPRDDGGHRSYDPLRSMRRAFFRSIVGTPSPAGSDGVVSTGIAHLAGARQVTFPDVLHGVVGTPWYGDAAVVDRWWPIALEVWRHAMAARGLPAVAQPKPAMMAARATYPN
jgi:hypothetical protein